MRSIFSYKYPSKSFLAFSDFSLKSTLLNSIAFHKAGVSEYFDSKLSNFRKLNYFSPGITDLDILFKNTGKFLSTYL